MPGSMSDLQHKHLHEANRQSWNAATVAHNSHKRDQAVFLRDGGSTLFPEEVELLGDVTGKRLLHLQCNAGQDTLSIARLGAIVTGVDISDEAVQFARTLSDESGIKGEFHRADVYDWLAAAQDRGDAFDIVFCSYGSICWLSDLERWATGLAGVLAPGGRFVTVDFHPVSMIFDEHFKPAYAYFSDDNPLKWEEGIGDYVGRSGPALAPSGFKEGVRDFKNPHANYEFQWPIADILTAIVNAGVQVEQFREYPYSNGAQLFEDMREEAGRRMFPPEGMPSMPLMYGLVARKRNEGEETPS
jgi:SAM-dependent methyltransferase